MLPLLARLPLLLLLVVAQPLLEPGPEFLYFAKHRLGLGFHALGYLFRAISELLAEGAFGVSGGGFGFARGGGGEALEDVVVVGLAGGGAAGGAVEVDAVVGTAVTWTCPSLFGLFGLFRPLLLKERVPLLLCPFRCVFPIFALVLDKILCVTPCSGLRVLVEWVSECDAWNIWLMNWRYLFGVWYKRRWSRGAA